MSLEEGASTPRRSSRLRKPSLSSVEAVCTSYQVKSARKPRKEKSPEIIEISEDEETLEKPSILHSNETVSGNKMFAFQARKKRDSLLQKAAQVHESIVPKTPHAVRTKLKKDIVAKIQEENDSSDQDYSPSGSEYAPSDKEESQSSDNELESQSNSEEEEEEIKPPPKAKLKSITKNVQATKRANRNYNIKTDDYFANHSSKKILTSNHTLDKLETPRLPQEQLHKLLSKMKLGNEHASAIAQLSTLNKAYYEKWLYLLHENFNVLLYGLGSKKEVIDCFHEEKLKHLPVIVINGYFPSLTIKDVLDSIILNLLELKENPANSYEACELIEREFSYIPETHLYLIVFNIDMMRSGKTQNVFARLAAIPNIHLIASIDQINAPLIWDHAKLSKFNFTWWDVTSFHAYTDETSFESSMMVQQTGALALSSLRNVFLSLTTNSKGIYNILVKYQLENGKNQYYQGFAFKDLYASCREAFLVSSDLALRAQLTEFVDHKMVKNKRAADGTEYLLIPIANTLLQQFISEQT